MRTNNRNARRNGAAGASRRRLWLAIASRAALPAVSLHRARILSARLRNSAIDRLDGQAPATDRDTGCRS